MKEEFKKINTYITQLDLITFKYILPLVNRLTSHFSNKQIEQELGNPSLHIQQVDSPEFILLLKCYFFIANQPSKRFYNGNIA